MAQLKLSWETNYKHKNLSNRQAGKLLSVDHTVIARWIALPIQEEVYTPQYSFNEIAIIMKLRPNEVKVIYLNAVRKIKIILERRGIDIGMVTETMEDLRGEF